jgi:hypothetical protein
MEDIYSLKKKATETDPIWNKGTPMPEDYTCPCGIFVHPTKIKQTAIHTKDCPYHPNNNKATR